MNERALSHSLSRLFAFALFLLLLSTAAPRLITRSAQVPPPAPRVVVPGDTARPPSDAVVLFNGADLSQWTHRRDRPPAWEIDDGALVCVPGAGNLFTREAFDDFQLHLEFAVPFMPEATGQDRGNSGVYLQGRYEVQILDSFESATYPNGQCGAIYGVEPPLVNACRPPREWQSYDIIFRAARYSESGELTRPARITVLQNGALIQDGVEISESTTAAPTPPGPDPAPLMLQDHDNRVSFRNIWIRRLER